MDKALKTDLVIMTITSSTTEIGSFTKGQEIYLTPELAEVAIKAKVARWPNKKEKEKLNKAPEKEGDKHIEKEEVTGDGRE